MLEMKDLKLIGVPSGSSRFILAPCEYEMEEFWRGIQAVSFRDALYAHCTLAFNVPKTMFTDDELKNKESKLITLTRCTDIPFVAWCMHNGDREPEALTRARAPALILKKMYDYRLEAFGRLYYINLLGDRVRKLYERGMRAVVVNDIGSEDEELAVIFRFNTTLFGVKKALYKMGVRGW